MSNQTKPSKLVYTLAVLIILSIILEVISALFHIPIHGDILPFFKDKSILSIIDLLISTSYCILFFFLAIKGGTDSNSKYYMNWWITFLLVINALTHFIFI